jgi:hypothetical protein
MHFEYMFFGLPAPGRDTSTASSEATLTPVNSTFPRVRRTA